MPDGGLKGVGIESFVAGNRHSVESIRHADVFTFIDTDILTKQPIGRQTSPPRFPGRLRRGLDVHYLPPDLVWLLQNKLRMVSPESD